MSVEKRGTKALEYWAKKATQGYTGVSIDNMTTSWRDGRAFCALIHHFRPDLIDFDSLKAENILENNALAFKVAEQHLGIPALLDAEDMVSCTIPDRLSILTYVSQYYQTFAAQGLVQTPKKDVVDSQNSKNSSPLTPQKTPTTPARVKAPAVLPKKETNIKTDKVAGVVRLKKEECQACNKTVFLAEKILVGDPIQLRHRTCLKCARCSSQLTLSNYYVTEKGQFCCETCPDEEKYASDTSKINQADTESDEDSDSSDSDDSHSDMASSKSDPQSTQPADPRSNSSDDAVCKPLKLSDEEENLESNPSSASTVPLKPPRTYETESTNDAKVDVTIPPTDDVASNAPSPGIVLDRLKIFENKSPSDNSEESSNPDSVYPDLSKEIVEESPENPPPLEQKVNDCTTDEAKIVQEKSEKNPLGETQNIENASMNNLISDEKNLSIITDVEYPEDLNPFGDDDEDSSELYPHIEVSKSSNPFESDDESESSVKPKSLNPFGSDDDDDEPSKSKPKIKPPRPPPPTLKRNENLSSMATSGTYVPSSPSPSHTSLTPGGLRIRKKQKPAPTPPSKIPSFKDQDGHDEILSSKLEKNKQNLSKMNASAAVPLPSSTSNGSSASKFETGEWRRKKGPAPPRPVPQKRAIRKIPMSHVQQELKDIDLKQTQLERQGVLLETAIRNKTEATDFPPDSNPLHETECSGVEIEDMILQLFELVNEKNELFRRQTELMYLKRERRLEEEHAEIEYQIRCLMMKNSKTPEDTDREEVLIARLMKVVEQRDQIVNCLELERQREAVEDESIANHMIKYQEKYIDGIEQPDESTPVKKKKRKLKLLKKKKKKSKEEKQAKREDDKDIDESEPKIPKPHKMNWFKKLDKSDRS